MIEQHSDVPSYETVFTLPDDYCRDQIVVLLTGKMACVLSTVDAGKGTRTLIKMRSHLIAVGYRLTSHKNASASIIEELNEHGRDSSTDTEFDESVIVQDFTDLLTNALERSATDIHIRATQTHSRIELRIRKRIRLYDTKPVGYLQTMCRAAYNVVADDDGKDTSWEEGKIQEAQITMELNGSKVVLRYACSPAYPTGFDVSLRLLPISRSMEFQPLEALGYRADQSEAIRLAMRRPQGGIFVSGVTGSGKSTTQQHLIRWYFKQSAGQKRVITIEDPVEYVIPDALQMSVRRRESGEQGKDPFAEAIRISMRKDPDFIMVSEVRDDMSASLARKAIESGHPVMTTVHAGSPLEIVSRLESLGIQYPVLGGANFISALVYQVLIPTVCTQCRLTAKQAQERGFVSSEDVVRFEAFAGEGLAYENREGCDHCDHLGVEGMTVCAEVLTLSKPMRAAIGAGKLWDATELKEKEATVTVVDHALEKLKAGILSPTALEEAVGDVRLYTRGES